MTKGGAKRETLDQIIQQFEITQKAESLNVTRLIAGLIFTNQADQEWIERRFAAMHDFLWENSWTYRQSIEKAREEGVEQSVRKDIEMFVFMRFPTLIELAKKQIEEIHGEKALRKVLIAMYSAETEENAQHYLLALKRKPN